MTTIASFNVENLFSRAAAFETMDWAVGRPVLDAYREFNTLIAEPAYTEQAKDRMRELLLILGVYVRNAQSAIRRRPFNSDAPMWAWLRANRGKFDREPPDTAQDMEIVATGRGSWIGWAELATEAVDETGTRMTARVIKDLDADILAVIEAEDRPALLRLNQDLLGGMYRHIMLIDGNDERGIDVGIMTKDGYAIHTIRSNVDAADQAGLVFSRDCPQYQVQTPGGARLNVMINHFKSQSGGGGNRRFRQATRVRKIADELTSAGESVVVLGDLNEGSAEVGQVPVNLAPLFAADGPLVSCYDLQGFDVGPRPGTFDSCVIRNRLDYILVSRDLQPSFTGGKVYRKGVWGSRKTRPTAWETYQEMTNSVHQASDHAALAIDLNV